MPVKIAKLNGGGYRVSTPHGVKARNTSLNKAKHLRNLLNAIEHGWKPSGKKGKKLAKPRY